MGLFPMTATLLRARGGVIRGRRWAILAPRSLSAPGRRAFSEKPTDPAKSGPLYASTPIVEASEAERLYFGAGISGLSAAGLVALNQVSSFSECLLILGSGAVGGFIGP